jgi:hypothetical protein
VVEATAHYAAESGEVSEGAMENCGYGNFGKKSTAGKMVNKNRRISGGISEIVYTCGI